MKLLVSLCLFAMVAAATAAPPGGDVVILKFENYNIGVGNYRYAWEQSDGSKHQEQGQLKNQGSENEAIAVQGQYSWVGPDGVTYTVTYTADENGFHPEIGQGPGGPPPIFPEATFQKRLGSN